MKETVINCNYIKNKNGGAVSAQSTRDSNLELFRIIVMLLIIAHHYVVNSGLTALDGPIYTNPLSFKSLFLLVFGMWGKTGINCFVLITGYFMCTSQISLKKFLKLIAEIVFYGIVIELIFVITGYKDFSVISLIKILVPIKGLNGFTQCYLLFFLLIPFLNKLIHCMTQKEHATIIGICSFIYVILGSIPRNTVPMNFVSWFIVLYFIASYIRLYPSNWFDNKKKSKIMTFILVICSMISVIVMQWFSIKIKIIGLKYTFWFVQDANKILAVSTAVSAFCFFKNLKIKNSKFINTVATSTFGVLLIHANSDTMLQWLWKDTLNNVGMYDSNMIYIHAILSVIGIFITCVLMDILRRTFIEKPFFNWADKYIEKAQNFLEKKL